MSFGAKIRQQCEQWGIVSGDPGASFRDGEWRAATGESYESVQSGVSPGRPRGLPH
jgi:hypothetical protein